jgi:hypothetical protein
MDVVIQIGVVKTLKDRPVVPVVIKSVKIERVPPS